MSTYQTIVPDGYSCFYPYPTADVNDVNQTWWMKVCNKIGASMYINNSYSGSCVATDGSSSSSNVDRLEKLVVNEKSADVIIIFMGSNDAGNNSGILESKFGEKYESMINSIYELCGEEFNINSTKQLGVILFEKLGLKVIKKTKTGYSTDVEVLEKWGVSLDNLFKIKANVTQIVNHLTKEIDKIVEEVLVDLKIPYVDKLKMYFYLHELNERNGISTLCTKLKTAKLPYGQFVAKFSKVSESIPYSLSSDTNLYITAHNLCKARYVSNLELETVNWDDFKPAETIEEIKELFGEDVLNLVQGVTKLNKYQFKSKEERGINDL